jgi:hypothetical protein
MNPHGLGLRWQSAAATPLLTSCGPESSVVRSRFAGSQSGVALRFPPQSKTRAVLPKSSSVRAPSLSFPNLWVISPGCLP